MSKITYPILLSEPDKIDVSFFSFTDQKGPILQLNGLFMKYMRSYDILFEVKKVDKKPVVTKYRLRVLKGTPPMVDIK